MRQLYRSSEALGEARKDHTWKKMDVLLKVALFSWRHMCVLRACLYEEGVVHLRLHYPWNASHELRETHRMHVCDQKRECPCLRSHSYDP